MQLIVVVVIGRGGERGIDEELVFSSILKLVQERIGSETARRPAL